jgi:outer membrane receptor protein involved in Fe transport
MAPAWLSGVRLEGGVTGAGPFYADDANRVAVPGYALLNVTASLDRSVALGRITGVRGFVSVNNLAGRRYIGSAFLNPDVVNGVPVAFEPGQPRELVFGLSAGAF